LLFCPKAKDGEEEKERQQKSWKASLPITFQLSVVILTARRQQHL